MSIAIEEPRLLHALPGRMRVHLAAWPREGQRAVETRLCQVPGIHSVQVNPLTGNVLIQFDPTATDKQTILAAVQTLQPDSSSLRDEILAISPPHRGRQGPSALTAGRGLASDSDVVYPTSVLQAERPRLSSLELVDLMLKGACVVLNLILADGPLALLLGGVEVVRLFMAFVGLQSVRRRAEVWQEHSPLSLIVPSDTQSTGTRRQASVARPSVASLLTPTA